MGEIEKIAQRLEDAQEFCSAINKHLGKNFKVEGKTLLAWKRHFRVKIPSDLNFMSITAICAEIAEKYQQASVFRDAEHVNTIILKRAKSEKFDQEFQFARTQHQEQFKKNLSAESCRIAASLAVEDLETAISNQEAVHGFWVKTCNTLVELRKLLETALKALSGDSYMQKDIVVRDGGSR